VTLNVLKRFLCVGMAFFIPLTSLATERVYGILRTSGEVRVNGVAALDGSALFAGDMVQAGGNSAATVTQRGFSVLVMPAAAVKLDRGVLDLDRGTLRVLTSNNLAVHAEGLTVSPANPQLTARFEVAETDDAIVIAAEKGVLTVSSDQQSETVPEGSRTSHRRHRRGAAPAASGAPISGRTAAIIAGSAGAVAAGIIIATTGQPCPLSPSQPGNGSNCK
jgi:hypothetical protein